MGGKWSISQEGLNTPSNTADIIFCIQWVINSQALADYIRKLLSWIPGWAILCTSWQKSLDSHMKSSETTCILMQQEDISLSAQKDWDKKKKKNTELRKYWSPEEVIKSKNVKSILVKKVLHKVFWGKQTSEKSLSAVEHAYAHTYGVFDVDLTIKTHSCSFISTTAALQIITLFERDVLFTELICNSVTGLTGTKVHCHTYWIRIL